MSRTRCPVCWKELAAPIEAAKAFLRLFRNKLADKVEEAAAEAVRELEAAVGKAPEIGWTSRRIRPRIRAAMNGAVRKALERLAKKRIRKS